MRRVSNALSLAVAVYAFAGWLYVAAIAVFQPWTLSWQLTHIANWPRTDTFGEISFVVSFVAFVTYMLTRQRSLP